MSGVEVLVAQYSCEELERIHGVQVAFVADRVPRHLHDDVALCACYIVQEGLGNATRDRREAPLLLPAPLVVAGGAA